MEQLLQRIRKKIKHKKLRLVFPDGHEPRILKACAQLVQKQLAVPFLIGEQHTIEALAKKHNLSTKGWNIRDPYFDAHTTLFAEEYYALRKHKGITEEQARQTVLQSNYFGALLLKHGVVDGMVSGLNSSTKPFLPAFHIIGTKDVTKASSYFVMLKGKETLLFADCGLVIDPTPEELADIALATVNSARLYGIDPVLALLSFSTKGSAQHPLVDKVREATLLVKKRQPGLVMDGEIQVDAALLPSIARKKKSTLTKKATIFIFPNLDAGNISYKLTERLGGFTALGPLLQGLRKPVNDMSRGASAADIVNIACITALEALDAKEA